VKNADDKPVEGTCLCGAIRFTVSGSPRFCAHCYCPNCRRAHGAAFVTWAGFRQEQIQIVSGSDCLTRYLTDTGAARSFCGRCGSTLFYEGPRWPGEVHVALANLSDDANLQPAAHVYVDDRAPWWRISDELPQYGGETGMEEK